jgi:hypothetical protein
MFILTGVFLVLVSQSGFALTFDFINNPCPDISISNDDYKPNNNNWYKLELPVWYDSRYVTAFTIDMYGYNDDSSKSIDIWGKLGSNQPKKIIGYNVQNSTRKFILRLDLVSGDLFRNLKNSNGTWTDFIDSGDFSWPSLSDFDGLNSFLIGYACHFVYDKTSLHIEQQHSVPEPSTMLLLGLGLVGLAGYGRKKFR